MDYRSLETVHPHIPERVRELQDGAIDRRQFLRITTLLGLTATSAYAIAGKLMGTGTVSQAAAAGPPQRGGVIRISMQVPDVSSPHALSWNYGANVIRQTNDFLTRTGPDNITVPWLLDRWEPDEDLQTWDLVLRDGIRWSNGDALTAEDVAWNIRRWVDPAVGSSMMGLFEGALVKAEGGDEDQGAKLWREDAITVVDERVLRLKLQVPVLAIPENLFHYTGAILHPDDGGEYGEGALGTGAFRLTSLRVGEHARFERRDDYWGDGPYIDRLELLDHGDDPAAALAALASGQVNGLYEGSTAQLATIENLDHVTVHETTTAQTGVARVQCDRPIFEDARVRKAMRLAVDPRRALELGHMNMGDYGEHHHVCPIHPEYYELPFMERNVDAAKALLAEAGYPDGFETEIYCRTEPDWEIHTVQALVEMWADAGIRVKINSVPSSTYWDMWTEVPFGFTSWTHRPLGTMVLSLAYRTGVPWNESRFSNSRFDELLTKAEGILDAEERSLVMKELQEIMQEEGPIVQPFWRAVYVPMDKAVKGFEVHPTYYLFAEEWWLES